MRHRSEGVREEVTVRQCTLKSPIHCSGIGVHSGLRVTMTLHPAPVDNGIVFKRSDLRHSGALVPALWRNAVETPLCTTVEAGAARVMTIEHLMAAFYACGIDNVVVELDAEEIPVMDGSAAPFTFLIECTGRARQDAPRRAIRILKEIKIAEADRWASLAPGEGGLFIDLEIDFASPVIGCQTWRGAITEEHFRRELARARTFGFLAEVEKLRAMGLARGGSLENAIVISGDRILNEGGLRFPDEFVRHKVLDSVGDLYLAGAPLIGVFSASRTGHALNLRLIKQVLADPEAWEWVELIDHSQIEAPLGASCAALSRAVAAPA